MKRKILNVFVLSLILMKTLSFSAMSQSLQNGGFEDGAAPFYGADNPVPILDTAFSGTYRWDAATSTVTFDSSGTFHFDAPDDKFFIWQVPTEVKKIVINADVTVTGAFHSYADLTIVGMDRKTSVVYGTPLQDWADKNNPSGADWDEWHYCQFLNYGGTLYLENFTSLNPMSYHVRGWGFPVHAKKVDFIDDRGGFGNHSDGFTGGHGSTVDSCYFSTGDDVIKVYFDILVTNTVIDMIQNAVPIQFGWGSYGSGARGVFKNVTIQGSNGRGSDNRVISAHAGTYNKELIIQNSTIYNPYGTLFNFMDETAYIDVMISFSDIELKNFKNEFKADTDIYINGSYYDASTTQSKWTVDGDPDSQAPTVTMTLPTNTLSVGGSLNVTAEVTDNLEQIWRVELYMNDELVAVDRTVPYDLSTKAVVPGEFEVYVKAVDADLNEGKSETATVVVEQATEQLPYNGVPFEIPIRIEAEEFDVGGEGVSYHDSEPGRAGGDEEYRKGDAPDVEFGPWESPSGGYALAWVQNDEWYEYTINVKEAGDYDFYVGYCTPNDSLSLHFKIDDVVMDSIELYQTGDVWNVWAETDHFVTIPLAAGQHVLQVFIAKAGFNLDYIDVRSPVSAVESERLPAVFALLQNYPNPFNPETTISYHLNAAGHTTLTIYNVLGQNIRTLVDGVEPAGVNSVTWNGLDDNGHQVYTGIYFYKLETEHQTALKKMILVK